MNATPPPARPSPPAPTPPAPGDSAQAAKRRPPEVRVLDLPDPEPLDVPGTGVRAHWHVSERAGQRSGVGVVVLPIQGGDYEVSTLFARHFAASGFHALRFERRAEWLDPEVPIERVAQLLPQFSADVQRGVTHWRELLAAERGPDQPPARLGMFGVSMGAIVGTRVMAAVPEFEAGVLCIGGGGLADIIIEGRDAELDLWRDAMVARVGNGADFEAIARKTLEPIDVLEAAATLDPARLLFVAARFDRVVPWSASVRLWEALRRPRRLTLPCGHYSAVVFVPLIKRAANRHFDRLLGG